MIKGFNLIIEFNSLIYTCSQCNFMRKETIKKQVHSIWRVDSETKSASPRNQPQHPHQEPPGHLTFDLRGYVYWHSQTHTYTHINNIKDYFLKEQVSTYVYVITINEKKYFDLTESKEGNVGGFEERRWKGEMLYLIYNLKN